jgi:hypothetical protein
MDKTGDPGAAGLRPQALMLAALAMVVAGCAGGPPSRTVESSPSPVVAEATSGPFKLQLELPRDWHATDTISGEATLSLEGAEAVHFITSGEPIIFSFKEEDGGRYLENVDPADCRPYTLEAAKPLVVPIHKSGAYQEDAPPSDFAKWFMTNPRLQLPVGTWRVTATAYVNANDVCSSRTDALKVSVDLRVTP